MKNINDINTDLNRYNREQQIIKDYFNALEDDDFKRVVTKLKCTEDVAKKYTSQLQRTTCELKNCHKCKCLEQCKNPINGCVYYPKLDNKRLIFNYVACKYMQEKMESDKLKSIIFKEPFEIENARMADIDLTDKKRAKVLTWINKFYKNYEKGKPMKGLYLHGSFGSGKSFLLAALLNELAKKGAKCVIMYYQEMLVSLKESFNFNDEFENRMNLIKTADLLLIDDIGAESVTPWNRDEILGTILQYRMDSKLPTFFTSNLTIEELEINLSQTRNGVEIVKSKRIIERIKQLTDQEEMISENRRK